MPEPSPLLTRWLQRASSSRTCIIDGAGAHSYVEIHEAVRRIAGALVAENSPGSDGYAAPGSIPRLSSLSSLASLAPAALAGVAATSPSHAGDVANPSSGSSGASASPTSATSSAVPTAPSERPLPARSDRPSVRPRRSSFPPGPGLDGERVALLISPGAHFVEALFGVLLAGGCVVVLSTLHPAPETAYFCEDAGVKTILVSRDLLDRVAPVTAGRRVIVIEDAREHEPIVSLPDVRAKWPALQLYTSGTTGKPKGAVITHMNLAVQQALLGEAWAWSDQDTLLHVLPLHHMHGLAIALLSAIGAGAATCMPGVFHAESTWDALAASTVLMAVPTIYAKLLAAYDVAPPEKRALWASSAKALRLATSGSAALPVTLAERWRDIAGSYPVERFGMTEIGVGSTNPIHGERRPGTVGKPLPSVDTRIVHEAGEPEGTGELWISGPSVFQGYFGRPDADTAAFVIDDGVRWFKTGDTVTRDADGYLRILGRTSVDILKSGGYKLSALEIEEALRKHPAVGEVAVVGVPDETWGDRVVACVIAREGREHECDETRLREFVRERLAPYKVPRQVLLVADLPRNAVGKVMKPELVKRLTAG